MGLTILNVGYPLAQAGPDAVGGAEQVLSEIDRALVREGHRSLVIAPTGSRCFGELVPIPAERGPLDEAARGRAQEAVRRAISTTLQRWPIDVVHLHGLDFAEYLPPPGPAALATLHLPPAWYPPRIFNGERVRLVTVSPSQRAACPPPALPLWEVPNGVRVDPLPFLTHRRFALALGRVCPEKGFHLALEAASLAGLPLFIGGRVFAYPEHQAYFDHQLSALLKDGHRFLGPLGGARKRRLLSAARCLLIASQVPETSSLVAMEALACGTPVVAFRAGALPDIVEHGRTGFLVDSVEEMALAIQAAGQLDREACRRSAEERFNADTMTSRYLELYASLSGRPLEPRPARPRRPVGRSGRLSLEEVTSVEGLEAAGPEWADLWERCPYATIFQRPEWLIAWCRSFSPEQIRTLLLRDGERLVGLLPFQVERLPSGRRLSLLGLGNSDYLDVLLEPGASRTGQECLRRWLLANAQQWDLCHWELLQARSPLVQLAPPEGWAQVLGVQEVCPQVALPSSAEEVTGLLAHGLLHNLGNAWRRSAHRGPLRVELAGLANLEGMLDRLEELHAARWQRRGVPGVLADTRVHLFHRTVARQLLARGMLRLSGLYLGDQLIAVLYAIQDRRVLRLYLSGFDPAEASLSPGAQLILDSLVRAAGEGARVADFLRGGEAHKYRWGSKDRWLLQHRMGPSAALQARPEL